MTDILAQRDSTGIYYEPYERDFKLCIHEEPDVQGRNERYEFRCDEHLSCCGRVCCVPTAATGTILGLPWWLLLLPLLLLLLLLLAALAYLLYRLCRKKRGEKEVIKRSTHKSRHATRPYQSEAGYRSIDRGGDDRGLLRQSDVEAMPNGGPSKIVEEQRFESAGGFGRPPFRRSFHEEETFEEEFHEEIQMERGGTAGGGGEHETTAGGGRN